LITDLVTLDHKFCKRILKIACLISEKSDFESSDELQGFNSVQSQIFLKHEIFKILLQITKSRVPGRWRPNVMAVISDAFHLKGSRRPLALSDVNLSAYHCIRPSEPEKVKLE
jgi:hypothetical protein